MDCVLVKWSVLTSRRSMFLRTCVDVQNLVREKCVTWDHVLVHGSTLPGHARCDSICSCRYRQPVLLKTATLKTKTKTETPAPKTKTKTETKTKTKTETEAPKHKHNVNIIESQIKAVMYHE